MAGESRYMLIEGKWVDTATPEFQKSMQKMQQGAQQTGQQVEQFIGKDAKKAMSQLGEKGEKARMMLTMMGGQMGAVGGQAAYLGSQISMIIGKFKAWEYLAMGLTAAFVGLGFKIYDLASQGMRKLLEETKKVREESQKLREETDRMIDSQINALLKVSEFEVKAFEIRRKRRDLELQVMELEAKRAEAEKDMAEARVGWSGEARSKVKGLGDEIIKTNNEIVQLNLQLTELGKVAAASKKGPGLLPEDIYGGGGGLLGMMGMGASEGMYRAMDAMFHAMEQMIIENQRKQLEIFDRNANEVINRREAQLRAQFDLEVYWEDRITQAKEAEIERRQENQRQALQNTIGLFSTLGELVTRGTKAHTAARIAAILMQAVYDAAVYTYKGFAALADPTQGPWAAANYFTAAALAAAVAAGKVQGAASGGGRGSSVGARESAQGGWRGQEPERSEGLTIHIHAGVLTGSDAGKEILNAIRDHDDAWSPGRTRPGMS